MRILVTGALGVVGLRVVRRLVERGHEVTALDARADPVDAASLPGGVRLLQGDVRRLASLVRAVKAVEVVVHTAAMVATDVLQDDPLLGVEVNVLGATNVFEAARLNEVRRVVFASSRAVYGPAPDGRPEPQPVPEGTALRPAQVYDVCKVAAEGIGAAYRDTHGLEYAALRFATIYGPGKTIRHTHASVFSRVLEAAVAGERVRLAGGRRDAFDLLYVEDAAEGLAAAACAPSLPSAAYNISSGTATPFPQFVETVQEAVPGADIALDGDASVMRVVYRLPLDPALARDELGFRPAFGLKEGVAHYVEALRTRST